MQAEWMVALYPLRWRERYEAEMRALLQQHTITCRTVADLLAGALKAHLDPYFWPSSLNTVEVSRRNRSAHRTSLWAFPLLVCGYMCLLDGLDDALFLWNRAHPGIWQFKLSSEVAVAAAVFSFLLTVFPIALATIVAQRRVSDRLLRFALPFILLIVLAMSVHILYTAVWGYAIWRLPTPAIQSMAHAAHRHIWPGDRWRLQIVGGVLWMGLLLGYMVRCLWRSFHSLWGTRLSERITA
jgi:hypothetical protein